MLTGGNEAQGGLLCAWFLACHEVLRTLLARSHLDDEQDGRRTLFPDRVATQERMSNCLRLRNTPLPVRD
jgi:hypothetical protein